VSLLQKIVPDVVALLACFRELGLPVFHTREAHKADLSDCPDAKLKRGNAKLKIGDVGPMGRVLIDGESGNEIIPELLPIAGEIELSKPGKGAFYNTDLEALLKLQGISHLVFAGVTTEVCVQTTMREANDRGYECLLVDEATESYFPEFKQATIDMIVAQGGIVGWVASLEDTIAGLGEAYGH
jgi:nicotinamidase-related amidase